MELQSLHYINVKAAANQQSCDCFWSVHLEIMTSSFSCCLYQRECLFSYFTAVKVPTNDSHGFDYSVYSALQQANAAMRKGKHKENKNCPSWSLVIYALPSHKYNKHTYTGNTRNTHSFALSRTMQRNTTCLSAPLCFIGPPKNHRCFLTSSCICVCDSPMEPEPSRKLNRHVLQQLLSASN